MMELDLKKIQFTLVRKRLRFSLLIVLLYGVHKIFDLHDKPFSFDNHLLGFLGFLIILAGLFLRSWAAGVIVKNKRLTDIGPYALWRHPLYIGSLLLAIGFCIILKDWFLWVIALTLILLIYLPKIKQEEENLSKKFAGEWMTYRENTGILLWRNIDIRKVRIGWSWKQWLHNREFNAWLAVTAIIILIEVWHVYY